MTGRREHGDDALHRSLADDTHLAHAPNALRRGPPSVHRFKRNSQLARNVRPAPAISSLLLGERDHAFLQRGAVALSTRRLVRFERAPKRGSSSVSHARRNHAASPTSRRARARRYVRRFFQKMRAEERRVSCSTCAEKEKLCLCGSLIKRPNMFSFCRAKTGNACVVAPRLRWCRTGRGRYDGPKFLRSIALHTRRLVASDRRLPGEGGKNRHPSCRRIGARSDHHCPTRRLRREMSA